MPWPAFQKPFIVPVFIPHAGCPHRCVFCNQATTTGSAASMPTVGQLHGSIQRYLGYRRHSDRYTEIAFFGGNFLGLPAHTVKRLLTAVTPYVSRGVVNGIRFSTRPDTIDAQRLRRIAQYPVTTVELGVQSMSDEVLAASRRGHTAQDSQAAVVQLKQASFTLGLQMMVGLPGDTPDRAMETGRRVASLAPDFVRIYPTLVIEGSPLARWYRRGRYRPWDLQTAIHVTGRLYRLFADRNIAVARMGLQPTDALAADGVILAGPYHPAFGEQVLSGLWYHCISDVLSRRRDAPDSLVLSVHPHRLSRLKGNKGAAIERLKTRFGLSSVRVGSDSGLPLDTVRIDKRRYRCF